MLCCNRIRRLWYAPLLARSLLRGQREYATQALPLAMHLTGPRNLCIPRWTYALLAVGSGRHDRVWSEVCPMEQKPIKRLRTPRAWCKRIRMMRGASSMRIVVLGLHGFGIVQMRAQP